MSGKRWAVAGAVAIGAAVVLAGSAGAESPSGAYTWTVVEAVGKDGFPPPADVGDRSHYQVATCGPECLNINGHDFHLVGNSWTGSPVEGCTDTINREFTVLNDDCTYWTVKGSITKDG